MRQLRRKRALDAGVLAGGVPTIVYLLFILVPLVGLLVRAAVEGGLGRSFGDVEVLQALRLSLVTSVISMAVVVLLGTPVAHHLARRRFPGRGAVEVAVQAPLVLPPVAAGLAMLVAFGPQGLAGRWLEELGIRLPLTTIAVVMAQTFVAAPFYIRAATLGFQSVDRTYEDLARTLGQSPWGVFWRVSLPLAWPALVGGLALSWARALGELGATLVFAGSLAGRTQTMPLAVLAALERDLADALALAVILLVFAVLILAVLMWMARRGGAA